MVTYRDQQGNTHVIMRNGDHYVMRGSHYGQFAAIITLGRANLCLLIIIATILAAVAGRYFHR